MLPYNEKGVRKLQENFGCFHDKLSDDEVYQCFMVIVSKAKKFAKPDLKVNFSSVQECSAGNTRSIRALFLSKFENINE